MLQNQQRPRVDPIRTTSIYGDDVSPPDSPRTGDGRRLSSNPDISPITDAGSAHRFPASRTSNIPLPRQASNGGTANFISGWREKIAAAQAAGKDGKIKWDDYSGDPTSSEAGKDATARPGSTQFDLGSTTHVSAIPQPKQSLFGVSLKKTRKDPPLPRPKEEWKGATGREPILPPVEQKLNPNKQFFPSPMQRRQKGGFRQAIGLRSQSPVVSSPTSQNQSPNQAIRINTQNFSHEIPDESDLETPTADTPIEYRTIPPRGESMGQNAAPQRGTNRVDTDHQEERPLPPIPGQATPVVTPRVAEHIPRKPVTPRAHTPEPDVVVEPVPQHDFNPGHVSEAFARLGIDNEPVSRFSATTVATTIAEEHVEEPDQMPEPELPMPTESVLNRRRPIQASGYLPRSQNPSRKPTPSERDIKSLPAMPADETSVDRVTLLEAKLSSLNKRKANIQTVIHELTNVVQPSSIAYDNASRQEIRKTVESLQIESAAVAKEIHETGLKLHRAMKKRDDASAFEPTGLWVRRVTE